MSSIHTRQLGFSLNVSMSFLLLNLNRHKKTVSMYHIFSYWKITKEFKWNNPPISLFIYISVVFEFIIQVAVPIDILDILSMYINLFGLKKFLRWRIYRNSLLWLIQQRQLLYTGTPVSV